jgi:hypothetical protein
MQREMHVLLQAVRDRSHRFQVVQPNPGGGMDVTHVTKEAKNANCTSGEEYSTCFEEF